MDIIKTEPSQYQEVADLAYKIWREHYTPIIGPEQVEYMLEKYQSVDAINQQIADGYEYYNFVYEGQLVGYLCIKEETDLVFISKIYVDSSMRGKGFGRKGLEFVDQIAKNRNLSKIRLTVNKYNTGSIAAYEKIGFVKNQAIVMDIGSGYVMDDYEMIKSLNE